MKDFLIDSQILQKKKVKNKNGNIIMGWDRQGRAGQRSAGQGRAGQYNRAEQNRTEQNRTEQNRTEQNSIFPLSCRYFIKQIPNGFPCRKL